MELNDNYNDQTLLPDWWRIVKENFDAIKTAMNENISDISAETTARQNADDEIELAIERIENLLNGIGSSRISPKLSDSTTYGNIPLGINTLALDASSYSGYSTLRAMAAALQSIPNIIGVKKYYVSNNDYDSIGDGEIAQLMNDTNDSVAFFNYLGDTDSIDSGEFKYIIYETRKIEGASDRRYIRIMDGTDFVNASLQTAIDKIAAALPTSETIAALTWE